MPEIAGLSAGLLHAQILHTSAALTLNENADPSVGIDLATWLDEIAPEDAAYWTHTLEGPDDMPAHAKAALLGASVSVPIAAGLPQLGTWQGCAESLRVLAQLTTANQATIGTTGIR
ncbi:MAG: secondary thiamine-phosphate synthase enzyme YjbQ [Solirubrobacterales bacterium]|nr:secondary thiamine-phosphate synthase enzyme YjbQ [Solirubrobacterales bacterium]